MNHPGGELDLPAYDYELPPERIAQEPAPRREHARLLVLERRSGAVEHRRFADTVELLEPGDLLVVNDTRVIPARLRAQRPTGGSVEVLLLEPLAVGEGAWSALLRPAKAGRPGSELLLAGEPGVAVHPVARRGDTFTVEIRRRGEPLLPPAVLELCERCGEPPLPPYISRAPADPRRAEDRVRYQTVYAQRPGAVAAPTAGLHFSQELLEKIERRGVERVAITLHVGLGTFQPLKEENLARGRIHAERVEISERAGGRILAARREGRRLVAVGTTVVRALESFALAGTPLPYRERTELFIRPGHTFQLVDALVTNFHLPRSSLLVLVSAFAGREKVLAAYREACERGYRFYSYGDASWIA